jgi:integrase
MKRLRDRFMRYASASTAPNTRRVYERAWANFIDWCNKKDLDALPAYPETVGWYAIELVCGEAGRAKPLKVSSVFTELAAITHKHIEARLPPPTRDPYLRVILRGLRREHGTPVLQADPLLRRHIRAMVACVQPGLTGTRDLALLTFGWASAARRSELTAMITDDLKFGQGERGDTCVVGFPKSKGDRQSQGQTCAVRAGALDVCPVSAVQTWLSAAGIRDGALFRKVIGTKAMGLQMDERSIDALVRQYVELTRARYPNAIPPGRYSAHSLRAGCATTMHLEKHSVFEIRDHLRHKSLASTMKYVRFAKLLEAR